MFKKVFAICPAFYKSGGPELIHQYVKVLLDYGIDANIAYINHKNYEDPINPEFKKYISLWTPIEKVEDKEENIVIFPETHVHLMKMFKNVKKVIFWGSEDNYLKTHSFKFELQFNKIKAVKNLIKGRCFDKTIYNADLNLCQSEYARLFLEKKGIKNVIMVSDYLNDIYLLNNYKSHTDRLNIVLYNPKKGYKFTSKLIKKSKASIKWEPIQNMTTDQVFDLLNKGKLYVDFGNHPGKDRFPREAAMCGCCVITGKRGSAANDIDVTIYSKYKFAEKNNNLKAICDMIEDIIFNYDKHNNNFDLYREKIKNEKDRFLIECKSSIKAFEKLY